MGQAEAGRLGPDAGDRRSRTATSPQFYYHSHAEATDEDGHFHTVRLFDAHTVHVVAISIATTGWPQALFTTNLWAVGDRYASPSTVKTYVRHFRLRPPRGDPRLVRFVNLMFEAYRDEIEWLQDEKERALLVHRAAQPDRDPFDDRSLEVLSLRPIDLG